MSFITSVHKKLVESKKITKVDMDAILIEMLSDYVLEDKVKGALTVPYGVNGEIKKIKTKVHSITENSLKIKICCPKSIAIENFDFPYLRNYFNDRYGDEMGNLFWLISPFIVTNYPFSKVFECKIEILSSSSV